MYKLVIGNVKVTVLDDDIDRSEAIREAKNAIAAAGRQGKLLSNVEIGVIGGEIEVETTEKAGASVARKTLKHSMADGILAAVREKLCPSSPYAQKDLWVDIDTGQEWRGSEVDNTREQVLKAFEEWTSSLK